LLYNLDTPVVTQVANFSNTPGATAPISNRRSPIDCFLLLFTNTVLKFLVDSTNAYANIKVPQFTRRCSLYRTWTPVTVEEMMAFIALILNMGITRLSKIEDYWRSDIVSRIPFFPSVFSRDCFFQIFGMIHVGNINSPSKLEKIQPFIDLLLPIIQRNYVPRQQVSIDESVIQFKGRTSFRQYLKGKPHPSQH
jgi:hypothetical protein